MRGGRALCRGQRPQPSGQESLGHNHGEHQHHDGHAQAAHLDRLFCGDVQEEQGKQQTEEKNQYRPEDGVPQATENRCTQANHWYWILDKCAGGRPGDGRATPRVPTCGGKIRSRAGGNGPRRYTGGPATHPVIRRAQKDLARPGHFLRRSPGYLGRGDRASAAETMIHTDASLKQPARRPSARLQSVSVFGKTRIVIRVSADVGVRATREN